MESDNRNFLLKEIDLIQDIIKKMVHNSFLMSMMGVIGKFLKICFHDQLHMIDNIGEKDLNCPVGFSVMTG